MIDAAKNNAKNIQEGKNLPPIEIQKKIQINFLEQDFSVDNYQGKIYQILENKKKKIFIENISDEHQNCMMI